MRRFSGSLAIACLALGLAAPARADFTLASNPGGARAVCDFRAAGARLSLLLCGAPATWLVSDDQAATWREPSRGDLTTLRAVGNNGDALSAYGATDDGAAFMPLSGNTVTLSGPDTYYMAEAGVPGADGTQRLLVSTPRGRLLVAADAAGIVTATTDLGLSFGADLLQFQAAPDGALWLEVRALGNPLAGWLRIVPGQAPQPLPLGPLAVDLDGGLQVGAAAATINGITTRRTALRPVTADLFQTADGTLVRRAADDLYPALWFQPPGGSRVITDGRALYAARVAPQRPGESSSEVWTSPLPGAAPEAVGAVAPAGLELVRAANTLRGDAGLPPLLADERLSRAAENHSRYLGVATQPSTGEVAGTPGYTGTAPGERCAAVGTTCVTEAVSLQAPPAAAYEWMASGFQRATLADPLSVSVGAAKSANGPSVLDAPVSRGVLLRPRGFPNGVWRGAFGYPGEVPDPGRTCTFTGRLHIKPPYGTAVSVYVPAGGRVTDLKLYRAGDHREIPACRPQGGLLVPDDELEPATEYEATAQWTLENSQQPAFNWRFRTGAATLVATLKLRAGLRLARHPQRRHGRWTLRVLAGKAKGRPATIRIRGKRTTTRTIRLKAANTLRLPARGRHGWRITIEVPPFTTQRGVYKATRLVTTRR